MSKSRLTRELEQMALDILQAAKEEETLKVKLDAFTAIVKYQQVANKLGDDDGGANPIDEIREELTSGCGAPAPTKRSRRA